MLSVAPMCPLELLYCLQNWVWSRLYHCCRVTGRESPYLLLLSPLNYTQNQLKRFDFYNRMISINCLYRDSCQYINALEMINYHSLYGVRCWLEHAPTGTSLTRPHSHNSHAPTGTSLTSAQPHMPPPSQFTHSTGTSLTIAQPHCSLMNFSLPGLQEVKVFLTTRSDLVCPQP